MGCNSVFACGFVLLLASPFAASAQPRIDHAGLECIEPGRFAVVLSGIDPGLEIQTAKVYFRSSLYPDFYYVEVTRETDRFIGVLPLPGDASGRLLHGSGGQRFRERSLPGVRSTRGRLRRRPGRRLLHRRGAGIVVGATAAGSSALPPGFSAVGIIGTITAAGVSFGLGGGVGAGVAVAAAAGAAGAAGSVVAATGGSQTTTTAAVAAAPTTVTTTTTTPPTPGNPIRR